MAESERLSPEFALVAALEGAPLLTGRVSALQPKKDIRPPFAFYISTADDEDQALDGGTGLQSYGAQLHLVGASMRELLKLSGQAKGAVRGMRGLTYSTPENGGDGWPRGTVLIERATITQVSPDLYESEVGYYRRVYSVRLDYQTEEVLSDGD